MMDHWSGIHGPTGRGNLIATIIVIYYYLIVKVDRLVMEYYLLLILGLGIKD